MSKSWKELIILGFIAIISTAAVWMTVGMQTVYENFDGPYYLVLAKCWYEPECIASNFSIPLPLEYYPAHFPLLPILINIVSMVGLNKLQAMVVISLVAGIGAAAMLYLMVREFKWGNAFWVAAAWLFMWPRMWAVRAIGSPETLLMLCVLVSMYMFMKKNYWLAALGGVGAVLAKPPGILLLAAYGAWWMYQGIRGKKWEYKAWPVVIMGLALGGLFWFYQLQTGDFWAYFHSGDNIHLQALPFKVFDSSQSWVGTFWLEDVLWIYLVGAVGIVTAFKKSAVLGWFGAIFFSTILFVSHRDIARYSLPIIPVVLIGLSEVINRREVKIILSLLIIPSFLYTVNFLLNNTAGIPTWQPFL